MSYSQSKQYAAKRQQYEQEYEEALKPHYDAFNAARRARIAQDSTADCSDLVKTYEAAKRKLYTAFQAKCEAAHKRIFKTP